jgi:anti-anti-sigma factor
MKRHQLAAAASVASVSSRSESGVAPSIVTPTRSAVSEPLSQPDSGESGFVPASVPARTHTLILTGELNRASAHALEAEIERLCEEGVTGITLDLRELSYIDSIGVAVIAFRCGLCERRGYDFAVIPGSRLIQRAFEQAGVINLLPFAESQVSASRLPAMVLARRPREGCEA